MNTLRVLRARNIAGKRLYNPRNVLASATAMRDSFIRPTALPSFPLLHAVEKSMIHSSTRRMKPEEKVSDEKPAHMESIKKIAVIGGGNMAEAMLSGLVAGKLVESEQLIVADPNPDTREKYSKKNIPATSRNTEAVENADVVLICVKPQVLEEAVKTIRGKLKSDALVISVVAGASISSIQDMLGDDVRVVRSMPNTPAMIGEGTTVWSKSEGVSDIQHSVTKTILGGFGIEVFVDDENSLDMATALSGSGPAYFLLVAEAMVDAGVHMGFPRAVATKLVQQTMLGSALYMQASDAHPVILRNNITSPGGTTAAALYRAEKNGFRAVIADSIWAAYERCTELGADEPVPRKRPRS